MSRSKKGSKGPGYEYWSRRPIARNHGAIPGRASKKITHRIERLEAKEEITNSLNEISEEIKERIQAYADRHKISFEEAQKRAKLVINGEVIPVGEQNEDN